MAEPTTERLARILEASGAPAAMIERARRGDYDDFKSESATPIVNLVRDLQSAGLNHLARRAMDGDFDATREEAEEWFRNEGSKLLGERGQCGSRGERG